MSRRSPSEIVAELPGRPDGPLRIERADGGLTNTTYRLAFEQETWMLRLTTAPSVRVGVDHGREADVLRRAAAAGLAPRVVHADPEAGILVTEWVSGQTWTAARLAQPARLVDLACTLRKVHELPPSGFLFEPRRLADSYLRMLPAGFHLYAECRRAADELGRLPGAAELRCCHNDLIAANVVGDDVPKLIDWEYACDNDPAFDLASLIEFHDLNEEVAKHLLDAYAADGRPEWRERVDLQRRVYVRLTFLWCAAYGDAVDAGTSALSRRMLERVRR